MHFCFLILCNSIYVYKDRTHMYGLISATMSLGNMNRCHKKLGVIWKNKSCCQFILNFVVTEMPKILWLNYKWRLQNIYVGMYCIHIFNLISCVACSILRYWCLRQCFSLHSSNGTDRKTCSGHILKWFPISSPEPFSLWTK